MLLANFNACKTLIDARILEDEIWLTRLVLPAQRTFQRVWECELQQITERLFRTALPKSRCGRSSRLIVSPSCSFTLNRPLISSNVLGVKVLPDVFEYEDEFLVSLSATLAVVTTNRSTFVQTMNSLLLWCCPCRTCLQVFRFRQWFHRLCCHFVWNPIGCSASSYWLIEYQLMLYLLFSFRLW